MVSWCGTRTPSCPCLLVGGCFSFSFCGLCASLCLCGCLVTVCLCCFVCLQSVRVCCLDPEIHSPHLHSEQHEFHFISTKTDEMQKHRQVWGGGGTAQRHVAFLNLPNDALYSSCSQTTKSNGGVVRVCVCMCVYVCVCVVSSGVQPVRSTRNVFLSLCCIQTSDRLGSG